MSRGLGKGNGVNEAGWVPPFLLPCVLHTFSPALDPASSLLTLQGNPGQTPNGRVSLLLPALRPRGFWNLALLVLHLSACSAPYTPVFLRGKSHGPFLGHKALSCQDAFTSSKAPSLLPLPRSALPLMWIWELRPVSLLPLLVTRH